MKYDIIIIGGGAAGVLAAILSQKYSSSKLKILIIEKNEKLLKKVYATGNGRCNILNFGKYIYFGDKDFADSVLGESCAEVLNEEFKSLGLQIVVEDENRAYPSSKTANSVVQCLEINIKKYCIEYMLNTTFEDFQIKGNQVFVRTNSGDFICSHLVLATGGLASKKFGNDSNLIDTLKSKQVSIEPLKPALCPLITKEKWFKSLVGQRASVKISYKNNSRIGEILFTEYGISGIPSMQLSRLIDFPSKLSINFLPSMGIELSTDKHQLLSLIEQRINNFSSETILNVFAGLINLKIARLILEKSNIDINSLAKSLDISHITKLVNNIINFEVTVLDNKGFDFAQVSAGGIKSNEVCPSTMKLKRFKNIYAIGEILNVDGDCGGYNLMFAFKCAYNIAKTIRG